MTIARDDDAPAAPAFNPLDPELWVNSYPILKQLRDSDPVYVDPAIGLCAVTGHEEVEGVFRNPEGDHRYVDFQKQRMERTSSTSPMQGHESVGADARRPGPPAPARTVQRDFTPGRVESLNADLVEIANALVDGFADKGEVEIVEAYSNALRSRSSAACSTWPRRTTTASSAGWRAFATPSSTCDDARAAGGVQRGDLRPRRVLRGVVKERRANPGDDLLTSLIVQTDEGAMTEEELVRQRVGMYAAGHETSGNAISDAILTLLRHPDQLALLQDDWSLLDTAVNELLRFDGPGLATSRLFPEDVEIGGHEVPRTRRCSCSWPAQPRPAPLRGSRPPRRHARDAKDHLGFGHGCTAVSAAPREGDDRRRRPGAVLAPAEPPHRRRPEWSEHTVFHAPSACTSHGTHDADGRARRGDRPQPAAQPRPREVERDALARGWNPDEGVASTAHGALSPRPRPLVGPDGRLPADGRLAVDRAGVCSPTTPASRRASSSSS